MKYACFLILLYFCTNEGLSQKKENSIKEFYLFKNELGINVTNVLGNVLSLNPNNASSPYGITYRRHMGKTSLRSAFNININNKEEDDFSNGSFINRRLSINKTDFRLGLEKHLVLSSRILFSYGFDVLGAIGIENSYIQDFNLGGNTFESNEKTWGGGAGPMLRLEYKISDRLFISTESSLYGFYSRRTEQLIINGATSQEPVRKNTSLRLELPQSLFFNISF